MVAAAATTADGGMTAAAVAAMRRVMTMTWRGMDTMLCLHHPMYKLYQGKHQATAVAVQRGNCLPW